MKECCPEKLLVKTLEESWTTEMLKALLVGIEQEVRAEERKEYFEALRAPYVRWLGRKLGRLGIGFVPKKGETMYTNVCNLKQKKELEERKDVTFGHNCKRADPFISRTNDCCD